MQMELKPDSVEEIINGSNQSTSEPDDVKTQESSKEPEAANDPQPQPEKRKRGRPKKKLEDMTASEQITLHAQRNTYSVEMADKETKKNCMREKMSLLRMEMSCSLTTMMLRLEKRNTWSLLPVPITTGS